MLFVKKNNEVSLFDEMVNMFNDTFKTKTDFMKTDIIDNEGQYQIKVDVPGIDKKDVSINVEEGYLTISVKREEEKNDNKYIRQERTYQSMSRSFYVGSVREEDIKAKLENGILYIIVPHQEEILDTKKYITIE